ncbi:unnamed protein product [Miscanthus lutarioriparius]|uniref:Uncharacterized protein n=1 Tax=Miscanthus lutarioriparius TaxID=422564 RepID=A0A811PYN5_9POAL|nr:unnamed protein product [Miscanthus lutarioriparius]
MAQPPETFPPQGITDDLIDFLQEIHDHLAYDPGNRDALFALFADFGKPEIIDDERVSARAVHLLRGHPHLVARFYALVDPVRQGLHLLKRAEKALGPANYDLFIAKLYSVDLEQSLDAHRVYQEFKELLGKKHDDLLRGLAGFLPTKYGLPPPSRASAKAEQEELRPRPERKHPSYAGADAPESSRPSRAKKPRVVDVGPTPAPACFADTGAAGSSRPSRARRPRMYEHEHDGSWPERKPAACAVSVADDGKSSRPNRAKIPRMYEYEYDGSLQERKPALCAVSVAHDGKSSRPSRAKKPRADDSMSRHALIGGEAGGSVRVAAAPAPAPDAIVREVKRFREAWEFETGYSLLDATLKRAEEVKDERERLNGARASLVELFPRPEIRGYLAKMYHVRWNHMRQLLEHGGDHTAFALEAIVDRLRTKDAEAVDEARRRQDPARAAQRLQELAQGRVRLEHKMARETNEANEQRRRQP